MAYVITCGDEGVQVNQGTRIGIAGAGLNVAGFPQIVKALKKLLGDDLKIAASAECGWVKNEFELDTHEQADATMQQRVEAVADKEGLEYVGFIPFTDPKELKGGIKAHMVRPKGMHLANKISFTLDGGEQTFHLGHYVVSAEWVSEVDEKTAKHAIDQQVEHYKELAKGKEIEFVFETGGELGEELAAKNQALLEKWGYKAV